MKIPNNIIFPFYHCIAENIPPHISAIYATKTPKQFEKDIQYLLKHFQKITIDEILEHLHAGSKPKKPSFYLTFDDGLQECYTIIAPILKKYNIPATFFLNPSFIDNKDLMFRYKESYLITQMEEVGDYSPQEILDISYSSRYEIDEIAEKMGVNFQEYLQTEQPYMTSNQIEELIEMGFHIGAHSMDHPLYENEKLETQVLQTFQSLDYIKNRFTSEYQLFAFPFSDYGVSDEFFETIKNKVDLTFNTSGIKKDKFNWNLGRFSLDTKKANWEVPKNLALFQLKNLLHFRVYNSRQ